MLRDSFDADGKLALERTLKIGSSLAAALAHAHAHEFRTWTSPRAVCSSAIVACVCRICGVMFALQTARPTSPTTAEWRWERRRT